MPAQTVLDCIGNTPLIGIETGPAGSLVAKAEFLNPGGSIKDRVARHLIEQAERSGELRPGARVVEATSGNTGIGVTLVAVMKGHPVTIVMPENMSEERKKLILALGAELILTPAGQSLDGCLAEVRRLQAEDPSVWVVRQFENPGNPGIHYQTTGPELWQQAGGRVDAFVAGVGSGGTLGGVGRFLKERNPGALIVAVEPKNASALLGQEPGLHQIQGIGDGFIPPVLDTSLIDQVITVSDENAIAETRRLARQNGLLVGTSSGANVWAARRVLAMLGPGHTVATVLPDRAERYFSTALI